VSRKKIIFFLVLIVLAGGAWYGYREYTRTNEDLKNADASFKLTASDLIHEYEQNDSLADQKYLGKILEVRGNVKEVRKDEYGYYTIALGDSSNMSAVRCALDTIHHQDAASVIPGSSAILRGNCTGFNKDETGLLGSDVILNRSVIVQSKK
jgi:hypothetical protein